LQPKNTVEHHEQNQTRGGISMKMQGSRSHGGGNSGSAQSANSWSCRENLPATVELFCYCGIPAPVKTSRTPKNNGHIEQDILMNPFVIISKKNKIILSAF
jgi:hypothetical protein